MIYPNTKVTAAQTVTRQVTASEAAVLYLILQKRAVHAYELIEHQDTVQRLLSLGYLHCRTTRIGQIICMSPQGNVQMNRSEMSLVSPSVSANIVYHRAARRLAQEHGYQLGEYINPQSSWLINGQISHLMLLNANTSGPSSDTIKRGVKFLESNRNWGNLIIVNEEPERYNYHIQRQNRIEVWELRVDQLKLYL